MMFFPDAVNEKVFMEMSGIFNADHVPVDLQKFQEALPMSHGLLKVFCILQKAKINAGHGDAVIFI